MAVTVALNATVSLMHFQLVKVVNFMLHLFYHNKEERHLHPEKKNELCKWSASVK